MNKQTLLQAVVIIMAKQSIKVRWFTWKQQIIMTTQEDFFLFFLRCKKEIYSLKFVPRETTLAQTAEKDFWYCN